MGWIRKERNLDESAVRATVDEADNHVTCFAVRTMRYLFPLLLFMVSAFGIANADKEYPTSITPVAGSPVTLTRCEAWARDFNKTALLARVAVPDTYFDLGIDFTNSSDKPVTALRVELTSFDSFNGIIASTEYDSQSNHSAERMSVSLGASMDLLGPKSWNGFNTHKDRDHVSCAITAVRFSDGSVWTASSAATPAITPPSSAGAAPAAQPSPSQALVQSAEPGTTLIQIAKMGSLTTSNFSAGSTWAIAWQFDCSKAAGDDTFTMTLRGGAAYQEPIEKSGQNGSGTTHFHEPGDFYVEVETKCSWHLRAYQ
jgi:hypothetical protein